ncbi:hypothetical protein HYC85_022330 [Camellia sinensis]|uniref:Protein phosphatase n=1 Tax=Camellia sinensis TaxID=4442 RepID=A0A7J7GK47_CAMSI|nr:hypothetical protein HYC85_022330 [Camellia sinensis]
MVIVKKRRRLVKLSDATAVDCPLHKICRVDSNEPSLTMASGSFYIPKQNEQNPLGDDAHFICPKQQTIGVADGVGGWARKGVDPGEYARELIANSVMATLDQPKGTVVDPKEVLNHAFLNTEARGSSTACILTLSGNILHAVNVGDSGFVLMRGGEIVYRSPVQQHRFNCPYQLGNTNDNPSLAKELKVRVIEGDIIVAGTDGLFDNLDSSDIEQAVNRGLDEDIMPPALAWNIARFAYYRSVDCDAESPFAKAAQEAGYKLTGGKIDDITVIVAYIVSSDLVHH